MLHHRGGLHRPVDAGGSHGGRRGRGEARVERLELRADEGAAGLGCLAHLELGRVAIVKLLSFRTEHKTKTLARQIARMRGSQL